MLSGLSNNRPEHSRRAGVSLCVHEATITVIAPSHDDKRNPMSELVARMRKAREFCRAAPIPYSHLASLVRRGALRPEKDGSGDHVFTEADLAIARAAVQEARDRAAKSGRAAKTTKGRQGRAKRQAGAKR
jgi:hypothetical protein